MGASNTTRVSFMMPNELLGEIDSVANGKYMCRADAIRTMLRNVIREMDEDEDGFVPAIYDVPASDVDHTLWSEDN